MLQCIFRLCVRVLKLGYNGVVGGVFGVVFGGGQFFRRRGCFFLFFGGRFLVVCWRLMFGMKSNALRCVLCKATLRRADGNRQRESPSTKKCGKKSRFRISNTFKILLYFR